MAINKLQLAEVQKAHKELEAARQGERRQFEVTDKASADWCMRKIAACKAEMKENEKLVKKEIERLQHWLIRENDRVDQSASYFSTLLGISVYQGG